MVGRFALLPWLANMDFFSRDTRRGRKEALACVYPDCPAATAYLMRRIGLSD
ncbi:hypothetical protein HGO38_03720 [Rhizobium sp. CG5]|uniref:hypothetical protein n=1 Tax=Rhizobium sp. CG5 TaxID=2726076 RepID=UPI0020345F29|nr:hypothetical protein [Rhizobium sp. CG5]MCM2472585.1 hypothetical protein [Rhizobium sp. CG5]